MKLAEQMSCSLVEVKARVTRWELNHWIAYWTLRQEAEEAAAKGVEAPKGKQKSKRRG